MRRTVLICMLVATAFFCFSFIAQAAGHLPKAEGLAVINYITKESPYSSWPLWPGKSKFYKGAHPHGAFLTTYVSADAKKAIETKAGVLPDGAMVIKENYSPQKKLTAITVMYKKKDYDPASGDWYWLKYAPNGKIQKEGKVAGCINCHKAVQGNDWVFTGSVK